MQALLEEIVLLGGGSMLVSIIPVSLHGGVLDDFYFGLTILLYILAGSLVSIFVTGLSIGVGSPLMGFMTSIEVLQFSPNCRLKSL